MARNTTLGQIVGMLRDEIGRSNAAGSAGVADFNTLKQLINRYYESLYLDYDWPHLRFIAPRVSLSPGERYYDVPTALDYERIEKIVTWTNGRPYDLDRGIAEDDYRIFSSEDGERADPPLKWDIRHTGTKEQIEIWPMPASAGQSFQITSFRKFVRLIADGDTCKLDDNLIVLFAAAEAADEKAAPGKLAAAKALYNRLRGRTKGASKTLNFAKEEGPRGFSRGVVIAVR